ncbi:MAG: alpha-2-macroglobulin family protein, partial [Verrucomicrobiales bacterium]
RLVDLFTDRNLYRPGETLRLKGLVRRQNGEQLTLPSETSPTLSLYDSAGRKIHESSVTLSAHGSFDFQKQLPAETVGQFRLSLEWPAELAAAENTEDWYEARSLRENARFTHHFHVQEFKRNAYESSATLAPAENEASETTEAVRPIALDYTLKAQYFQGTAVAEAKVSYYLNANPTGFYPDAFRDFLFGDHRRYDPYYWLHYYGYDDNSYYERQGSSSQSGELQLGQNGQLSHQFELDPPKFPAPLAVSVHSTITDARQQSLSTEKSLLVHPADFYLGLSRHDSLARVNEEIPLKLVAVTPRGERHGEKVRAKVTITREFHTQTKSKAPNGKVVVDNQKHLEEVHQAEIELDPAREAGTPFAFTPEKSGTHHFLLESTDARGRAVRTEFSRQVYGSKEYPWAYEDGLRIKLVSEQKRYQPGDTARLLVLSPIEGSALVTIERDGVLQSFRRELKSDQPVIEFPVTEELAPNAFVSVLVIKGAQDNLRKHKEPQLRLGYCQLLVDPTSARLAVSLETQKSSVRPGETISVSGQVSDHQGRPLANAEVTFYAEDEGTLAVMGYQNPAPLKHFHAPRPLRVRSGTSLDYFLAEDPASQYHANKGYFIGGGGDFFDSPNANELRRNFDPCAAWFPALRTAADGSFTATFPAPDTLTRYRLIAVAHHGASQFGTGTGEALVNKPLMLEPNPPRFAHQGDRLQPSALIQNTSAHAGTWKVSLRPHSLTAPAHGDPASLSREISLAAGEQKTVSFDVTFTNTGTATWIWHAEPVALSSASLDDSLRRELSDRVESTFEVRYPMPLLNEIQFVALDQKPRRLLDGFSPNLLDGQGHLELEFSRSRLLEAAGAADFLLTYPYGCLEQTTSSTIPWIAARQLRHLSPTLQKKSREDIAHAIQKGADRLLSMQTSDGGFSYWPNQRVSLDWATLYAAYGLSLCQESGAQLPADRLAHLARYLKNQLQGTAKVTNPAELENRCLALLVLARLGSPDIATENTLLPRLAELSTSARSFLALAIHQRDAVNPAARALLASTTPAPEARHWMSRRHSASQRLLALATIDPAHADCEKALDELLRGRHSQGHWRTTWNNAWALLALGAYAENAEKIPAENHIHLVINDKTTRITLDENTPTHRLRVPLAAGLTVSAHADSHLHLRSQLSAKPKIRPLQPVAQNGLQISRLYQRVKSDGSLEALKNPRLGELVKVTLKLTAPRNDLRYLAIDDPLPAAFEAINTDFQSQAGRVQKDHNWSVSNQEIRSDRVLFFIEHVHRAGLIELSYHARITSAGDTHAPPAKAELMYHPENFALSASQEVGVGR